MIIQYNRTHGTSTWVLYPIQNPIITSCSTSSLFERISHGRADVNKKE